MMSVCEFNCIDKIISVTKMADELTDEIADELRVKIVMKFQINALICFR